MKNVLALVLVLIMVLFLTACGVGNEKNKESTTIATEDGDFIGPPKPESFSSGQSE